MRIGVYFGALTAILIASMADAAILEEFTAEDWSGLALSDDATGRLASCAIYAKYQNGATLFIIKHVEGGWALSLVHSSWSLAENAQYPVQYKVDRQPYVEGLGTVLGTDQIGITLAENDPVMEEIRRGSLLSIRFEGREFGFELSNSGKALKAATDCLERAPPADEQDVAEAGLPPLPADGQSERQAAAPRAEAAALAQPAERTPPYPERQVFGSWVVAITRDDAGHFLNCTAYSFSGQDQLMLSHFPHDLWDIGVYRGAWSLAAEQSYQLRFQVDGPAEGASAVVRPVEVLAPTRISFGADAQAVATLASGRVLNLQLRGPMAEPQSLRFPLAYAAEALGAARECTRRNAQGT
jgi:hypothetical protein